ncbi:transglutaminase domain-containing protein [candidate division KSB1 bacterium]|nr:transglutaminase domain-containing protein [candidate division KSB1 bacterium]
MPSLKFRLALFFSALLAFFVTHTPAENYVLAGKQNSRIQYELSQRIVPMSGMKSLIISTVVPATFKSPTYNQEVSDVRFDFQPQPTNQEEKLDARGNKVITATWSMPTAPITASVALTATNWLQLTPLSTSTPFPVSAIAGPERTYLQATKQVPANDPRILAKAKELTNGVTTEFDAVQRVLAWVIDHMSYVLVPESYDAMYSFETGKGNCQNYSHLAAALLRSVGVPVRVVNGVTLKKTYDARVGGGNLTLGMAQGRHSWIDVYFPDLGWVPFDPQQSQLFTSNRYIRIEVGLDNEETTQDGLIRWTVARGVQGQPEFEESINADFPLDETSITAKRQSYGPKSLLLSPEVKATFVPYVAVATPPPPPPQETPKEVPKVDTPKPAPVDKPVIFGNLEFPEGVNFAFVREVATTSEGTQELRKNFLVETAEYVTRSAQYAQVFVLKEPLELRRIALALQKYGGEGSLWIEILKDENALPGARLATSEFVSVERMSSRPGYRWQPFDFSKSKLQLAPGRYWIALGFTGSPVVNWFYSYGKPVGPSDGTRYKTIFDETWSNSLSFEFNYRVEGMGGK